MEAVIMEFTISCPVDGSIEVGLEDIDNVILRESDRADITFVCPHCGTEITVTAVVPAFLMAAIDKSQEIIDGRVWLTLYKGNVYATARESSSSLYDQELSSMDIEGGFNQQDSAGFIKINAVRLMAHSAIMARKHRRWGLEQ